MKDPKKVVGGKRSRAQGKAFELRVRKDLESKGWVVDRWTNNVKIEDENSKDVSGMFGGPFGKLVPAKAKWNNFTKSMMMGGGGFPDFIIYDSDELYHDEKFMAFNLSDNRLSKSSFEFAIGDNQDPPSNRIFYVIGVECKMTGKLDKNEKQKCKWLLDNFIFSKILIASKLKEGGKVVIQYDEFKEKNSD